MRNVEDGSYRIVTPKLKTACEAISAWSKLTSACVRTLFICLKIYQVLITNKIIKGFRKLKIVYPFDLFDLFEFENFKPFPIFFFSYHLFQLFNISITSKLSLIPVCYPVAVWMQIILLIIEIVNQLNLGIKMTCQPTETWNRTPRIKI